MKYLLLTLTLILSVQCTAQSQTIPLTTCNKDYDHTSNNVYLKDTTNEMEKYVGIWKWTESSKEFTITLIKQKHHFNQTGNNNYFKDRLVGYYQYKENGIVIADTSSDNLNQDYGVKVQFILNCHSKISSIGFRDYKKNKSYDVILEKLTPTQIKFDGKEQGDEIISKSSPGIHMYYSGNTFPLQMVLTKQ